MTSIASRAEVSQRQDHFRHSSLMGAGVDYDSSSTVRFTKRSIGNSNQRPPHTVDVTSNPKAIAPHYQMPTVQRR
jgi:hypothetical protein